MEHQDEGLSTRDIAGGTRTEPEPERVARFERPEGAGGAATSEPDEALSTLLEEHDQSDLQGRWERIQTRFVDEPRQAVEDADALVASVMQRLADGFADERERLEGMWGRGEDVGTEDLRVALQRYRAFFQRLLAA